MSSHISSNNLESIDTTSLGQKDNKIFPLPSMGKDVPFKTKPLGGNMTITAKKQIADTTKGFINFNNIRNEMAKKERMDIINNSKIERGNSRSPVLHRDNSVKTTKLTPILNPLKIPTPMANSNNETITPSDLSVVSANREVVNNMQIIKKVVNPEERKFSIIDIMSSENKPNGDPTFKQITNAKDKAIYLLSHAKIIPLKQRIYFSFLTKFTNTGFSRKQIIADGILTMVERISILENGMDPVDYFKPSKTAQNAINFITQKQIDELKDCKNEAVINIFRCFNILCGIEYSENIIENFFQNNKEPLKLFVLNFITRKVNKSLNNEQSSKFVSFVSEYEYLQNPKLIYNINQTGSLLVYYINELYEYMKKIIKIDMKSLHEYRALTEELKTFEKIKLK